MHRQGLGKTRHIQVQYLWLQERVQNQELEIEKIGTKENPADLMTKYLKNDVIMGHLKRLRYKTKIDRANTAPELNRIDRVDRWNKEDERWIRIHDKPRQHKFLPGKCAGGPEEKEIEGYMRMTIGRYQEGDVFITKDEGHDDKDNDRTSRPWTGYTIFQKKKKDE